MDVAHSTVKRALLKLATPANSVDYSDDFPAKEKKVTHPCREKNRAGALTLAHEGIVKLDRVGKNLRVRKQTVTDFRFGLKVQYPFSANEVDYLYHDQQELEKAIYWSLEARRSFTEYLRNKQWTVRESPTEADLAIATDCKPDDIIISRDSDMLVYGTILTIWRPISRRQCLVYDVPSVLATLNISKIRLTVLGVVSKNDYNSNIYSLRCITNFGTIKLLERDGAPAM
ncbi:hypothetical protein BG011_005518, partial [Mortierella polycephala]